MDKELEEAIEWLQDNIKYYQEQIKFIKATNCDYYDEEKELYEKRIKIFKTLLNYIENSIPTSVVLEKLEKKKDEREEYWEKDEIMLNFAHDEKRAEISIEELKINNKNVELLGEIKCLQELLQEK